jgi:hypothetical protein
VTITYDPAGDECPPDTPVTPVAPATPVAAPARFTG